MGFVFISYSRQDANTVDKIAARLERDGFDVWIDRARIKGGELWTVAIVAAIDSADSFVLMLTPSATSSDNVRKEVQLAQDAKRRLFPLVIAPVTLPPQFRYQLAGIQMIDYAGSPETKYRELVEVLRTQRESLSSMQPSETRQVEVVVRNETVSSFSAVKQQKLIKFISEVSAVSRSKLSISKLWAGSLHVLITMPRRGAYVLKTAALNRDNRLLDYGIEAVRLDGEENYVWVNSGEIGPILHPQPRPAVFPRILAFAIGLVLIAALLLLLFPPRGPNPPVPPASTVTMITPTQPPATSTPQVVTATAMFSITPSLIITNSPTLTETGTATISPTVPSPTPTLNQNFGIVPLIITTTPPPTETFTPSPTTNPPPPPPPNFSANALQNGSVPCSTDVVLQWSEPFDPDGIKGYDLVLTAMHSEFGERTIEQVFVPGNDFPLRDLPLEFCEWEATATIRAVDNLGTSGLESILRFFFRPE
jgi:hypothetical protein